MHIRKFLGFLSVLWFVRDHSISCLVPPPGIPFCFTCFLTSLPVLFYFVCSYAGRSLVIFSCLKVQFDVICAQVRGGP